MEWCIAGAYSDVFFNCFLRFALWILLEIRSPVKNKITKNKAIYRYKRVLAITKLVSEILKSTESWVAATNDVLKNNNISNIPTIKKRVAIFIKYKGKWPRSSFKFTEQFYVMQEGRLRIPARQKSFRRGILSVNIENSAREHLKYSMFKLNFKFSTREPNILAFAQAKGNINRQSTIRCFLILAIHIHCGVPHGFNNCIERYFCEIRCALQG